MERPNIKDFFPGDMTPQRINNTFLGEPELYKFIQAQDAYIDYLSNQLEKSVVPKIVEAYEEYIKLLNKEIEETAVIAFNHGWRSSRVGEGIELRNKIAEIKSNFNNVKIAEMKANRQ